MAETSGNPQNVQSSETGETSETGQTATIQPIASSETIEARLLQMLVDLKSDADAISVKVDNTRAYRDSLFPYIGPMQAMMDNLGIKDKDAKLDEKSNKVIEAVAGALVDRGIDGVDAYELLQMVQTVAFGLKAEDLSNLDTTEGMLIADQVRDAVKLSMLIGLSENTQTLAKSTLAAWEASLSKLRGLTLQSTRVVPSETGTQGPNAATDASRPGWLKVTKGFEIGMKCANPNHSVIRTGTNLSGIYHYIREHYRECNNLTVAQAAAGTQVWENVKGAVNAVVNSDNPDVRVDLPLGGTLYRIYPQ